MKRRIAALIATALACASLAHAGNLVDVNVIDRDTGSTLQTYVHDGQMYVAGATGHRYTVRITNHTGARVLTVLSVDGVNAITGQTADPDQSGYVLGPYASTEVDGWRKNLSEVAQFNFTDLSGSYAARTGRPNNVGVIGVAVFREKYHSTRIERERDDKISARPTPPPPVPATAETSAQPPAAAADASAGRAAEPQQAAKSAPGGLSNDSGVYRHRAERKDDSIGTGHGARESSYATYTSFERESARPNEINSIRYDTYRNLIARGVIRSRHPIAVEPQPFPNQFVPDPS
jgi:hypothetical protein